MGLIQRELEKEGIVTAGISIAKEISARVKPPRTLFLKYPFGHPYGELNNRRQQLQIFYDQLNLVTQVNTPGAIIDSPYRWRRTKFD